MSLRSVLRSLWSDVRRSAILNLHALFSRLAKQYLIAMVPVPRGPTTILQFAAYYEKIGQHKRADVMRQFAQTDLLKVMPFMDVQGGAYTYTQEGLLPGVAFKGYSESYTHKGSPVGVVNSQVERLRILGGDLDIDKALVRTHGADLRDRYERRKIKALSSYLTDRMINGDSESDPRQFDGIKKRIIGPNLIDAGGPLKREILDKAIEQVDAPTHLIMNRSMLHRLKRADLIEKSESGFYSYTTVDDGTTVEILVADKNDKLEPIIGVEEGKTTSIYVVSIGDAGYCALQNGPMEVWDLGDVPDKPVLRTRIEWVVAQALFSGKGAARIHNIAIAPVVDSEDTTLYFLSPDKVWEVPTNQIPSEAAAAATAGQATS